MSRDLVAFLTARYDEAETVARDAPGELDAERWPFWIDVDDQAECDAAARYRDAFPPQFMLIDIAAKRRILAAHSPHQHGACPVCWRITPRSGTREDFPCPTLRALTLPFGSHPEYRAEWRLA